MVDLKQNNFDTTLVLTNIKRILIIGSVYTAFELVGLILSTLGFFESDIRLYVSAIVGFHLIYLPVLYYYSYKASKRNFKLLNKLEIIYFPIIIGWGGLFNALVYLGQEDITIFSIVIMLCSAVFIIRPRCSKLLFGGSILYFALLIYWTVESVAVANGLVFKSLIIVALAYTISTTNFKNRIKLHETYTKLILSNELLEEQVIRDSLTGLYNNGYTFRYIDEAIQEVNSSKSSLALIMIDIDDFKWINDNYGHLEGDKVIQGVANVLKELTGENEVPGRYGGEEFVVVVTEADFSQTVDLANNILSTIRDLEFTFGAKVTVSLGVAQWNNDTRESLIRKADQQLYAAKDRGKDQLCM